MPKLQLHGRISVHCRIGSLESSGLVEVPDKAVHCRIGSLEKLHELTF